ncbi:Oleosin 5 [Bienertia sinuspersici]
MAHYQDTQLSYQERGHHQQDLQQKGQEAIQSFKDFLHEKAPSSSNVVAFATVLPLGLFLLGLSGLVLFGSLIGLAVTTPVFVLFSPVIVPAVLTIGLALVGFLSSGAVGITGLAAFSWIINFLRGYQRGGTGMGLDQASYWAQDKAEDMGQRVKEMGQGYTDRAREV